MSALAQAPGSRAREFTFEAEDHAAISRLAYQHAGIVLPPGKAQLVYGRLAKRVRMQGMTSFADYIRFIHDDAAEREEAIDALTTNHTKFFREDHHFDHFMAETWPKLLRQLDNGGKVRLWSAACSSGEEPYTLAMCIAGADRIAGLRTIKRDIKILATDLSRHILSAARAGLYSADVAQSVPVPLRNAWMKRKDAEAEVDPQLREMVAFKMLNLLEEWPMRQQFDSIFCRNVMIYFDEPTKERLQTRLAERLVPGGFMYIGHSERLSPSVARKFTCVGRTIYQKAGA